MCEIGIDFANIQYYNKEMQKGMEDKLFFLQKLPQNQNYVFVDFGCADGSMINALTGIYENIHPQNANNIYVGYDISEEMIKLAKTNYHGPVNAKVCFTNDWLEVKKNMKQGTYVKRKYVLILSSVIHEVYSYALNTRDIEDFWNKVTSDFDYVVIRDMCPSKDIDRKDNFKIVDQFRQLIYDDKTVVTEKQLKDFEARWGSLYNNKQLIHFLLKYRWKVNWDREVNENYFPIYVENLIDIMFCHEYKIDYLERFRVPFLDKCIEEDFKGLFRFVNDFTHIKAIFSKKRLEPAE